MKDYEVKKILVEQEITDKLDLSNIFTLNEMVEVIDGPFSSFKGKITKIEPDKEKVKIEISIFGRANEVDLTMSQIKKI